MAAGASVWPLRVGLAVIALSLALCVTATVYVMTLPSVSDAPALVRRVLALHHGTFGGLPVPAYLGDAVVAVEDEHFYANFAVEIADGIGRATLAALRTSNDPGGSTIPQQLAKQLYGDGASVGATLREIGLGVKLSIAFSKSRLLNMYLNVVYFGHGFWGYVAASEGYFHTSPRRLDWAEAAMLAGLPQAPSAYDPLVHLARAKQRQRHVLDQLISNHYLTPAQADAAFTAPLPLQ